METKSLHANTIWETCLSIPRTQGGNDEGILPGCSVCCNRRSGYNRIMNKILVLKKNKNTRVSGFINVPFNYIPERIVWYWGFDTVVSQLNRSFLVIKCLHLFLAIHGATTAFSTQWVLHKYWLVGIWNFKYHNLGGYWLLLITSVNYKCS